MAVEETNSVSQPANPVNRSTPQDGDVVVARASKSGARYTVRQLPGAVQLSASTRDEAVRLARGFARSESVDLWYSEDGAYRLLDAHRRQGSPAS